MRERLEGESTPGRHRQPRARGELVGDRPVVRRVHYDAQFVFGNRPELAESAQPSPAAAAPTAAAAASGRDPVTERVLAIVAEKTGYPPDMLDLDLDLEADFGVDTVKQAETFAAVREAYGIPRQENLKLRDFPTLKHVVQFVFDPGPS